MYCPNGHQNWWNETEVQRLRKQLDAKDKEIERERQRTENARRNLKHEEHRHRATKGHLTRQKKRVANGVCPCCHRTFKQLAAHMARKHPDFVEETKG